MELRNYSDEDLWLAEALESDPAMMQNLGGPTPKDRIHELHSKRLNSVRNGTIWYFTIVPDTKSGAAGTIGVWETDWQGAKINETGWMVLPAFQGRGLVSEAGKLLLARARAERKFEEIHAFPSVQNAASNAICRKLGFAFLGEVEISYNGPKHRSNHWKIAL
jgi:RimJ/RimL family protein N-acetyltransferase